MAQYSQSANLALSTRTACRMFWLTFANSCTQPKDVTRPRTQIAARSLTSQSARGPFLIKKKPDPSPKNSDPCFEQKAEATPPLGFPINLITSQIPHGSPERRVKTNEQLDLDRGGCRSAAAIAAYQPVQPVASAKQGGCGGPPEFEPGPCHQSQNTGP